jgi:hypothetical protein
MRKLKKKTFRAMVSKSHNVLFWNRNHGYWASPWTRTVVADRDFAREVEHTRKAAMMDGTL